MARPKMTHQWVPYREGSAVQMSIAMVNDLKAQGVRIIPMHQGAEETVPSGTLAPYRYYNGHFKPSYNPAQGEAAAREAAAYFLRAFHGLPATREKTFVVQANGRVGLGYAFKLAAQVHIRKGYSPDNPPELLAPRLRWPMVDEKAEGEYLAIRPYDLKRQGLSVNIARSAAGHGEKIAALYTNLPNNPTGLSGSVREVQNAQNFLDEVNSHIPDRPIVHIVDDPYFGGLEQKEEGSFLKSPYEGVFEPEGVTPVIAVISLSKAFGMAHPGMHFITTTHAAWAKKLGPMVAASNGPSFDSGAMGQLTALLHPNNYPAIREHFAQGLHAKYVCNLKPVQRDLGEYLVDGDANMTRTLELPEVMSENVLCFDGQRREIRTSRQVAEFIANETGVAVVDQEAYGLPYLRLALKAEDPAVAEEGAAAIRECYEKLTPSV